MKKRATYSLDDEVLQTIDDLAKLFGVSRSVIIERAIRFIVENGYEGELFMLKRKKKQTEKKETQEIEKTKASGFKLTL